MLVTDRALAGGEDALAAAVGAAVAAGVNAVQLREKDLPPPELLPLAVRLREVTAGRALLIVNGPVEIALACGADGIHLPEGRAGVDRPNRPFLVGQSVHSPGAAGRAWSDCHDYLIAGPVYATTSHPGAQAAGPRLIGSVAGAVSIPVLAIGGLIAERVEEVVRAGASGVAVISAILGAASPRDAARDLREALDAAWESIQQAVR